ncbi:DUF433 domain-containing protein [Nocardia sp. NPDC046473]|uniref:DUF433 domain-containing protein n=1 Tax=Nocardia sp. NPDC046473 TaxID=3155733 RepID=UPI00340A0731
MSLLGRITTDPAVCHGKPVVRGLRYPVELLLSLLASGMIADEIVADYPELETADILAALEYAAAVVRRGTTIDESRPVVRRRLTTEELIQRYRSLPRVDAVAMRREADEFFGF